MGKQAVTLLLFIGLLISTASSQIVRDTLTYPVDNRTGYTLGPVLNGGYVGGTNEVTDEVGQYFDLNQGEVTGAFFWFGAKQILGTPDVFNVKVYQAGANGLPSGAPLASIPISTTDIDTTTFFIGYPSMEYISFPTKPSVNNGFYVAMEVRHGTSNDTIGIVSNLNGDGMGLKRAVMKSSGQWYAIEDIWTSGGQPADRDFIILPTVEYQFMCNMTLSTSSISGNTSCSSPDGSFRVNVFNGSSPYQYSTSEGQNGSFSSSFRTLSSLQGGVTYTVTVTDNNNCTATTSAFVPDNSGSNLDISIADITSGSCQTMSGDFTVNINSGDPFYFDLSGPVNTQVFIPSFFYPDFTYSDLVSYFGGLPDLVSGNYTLTITDDDGCADIVNFTIPSGSILSIDAISPQPNTSCGVVYNGQATLLLSGGNPPYTYYVSNGLSVQNGNFTASQYTITNLAPGSYSLTITDDDFCDDYDNFNIADNAPVVSVAISNINGNTTCTTPYEGSFQAAASGGSAPYTYKLPGFPSNTNGNFQDLPSGSYILMVTDDDGCTTTDQVIIPNTSGSNFSATLTNVTPNSSCSQPNGGFTINIVGGQTPYTLSFSHTSSQTTVLFSGSYSDIIGWGGDYSITVEDGTGCTSVISFTIPELEDRPQLQVVSVTSNTSCQPPYTGGVTVTAVGGSANYEFNIDGINYNTSGIFSGLVGGNHLISVEDYWSFCYDTLTVTIPDNDDFDITVNVTDASSETAEDGSATVTVSGGTPPYEYYWNDASSPLGKTISDLDVGTYKVRVEDAVGCEEEKTFTVEVSDDVGISQVKNNFVFNAFPNPATNRIHYELVFKQSSGIRLELINSVGRKVITKNYKDKQTLTSSLDVSHLPVGLYFLKANTNENVVVRRILIQR